MAWRISLAWLGLATAAFLCVAPTLLGAPLPQQADRFLREEDVPVLIGVSVLMLIAPFVWRPMGRLERVVTWRPSAGTIVIALAILVTLIAWLGASWVFGGYPLSRDEDMAAFDAAILAHGQAWAPLAPQWRSFAAALEPEFVRFSSGAAFWQSAYLPVSAGLRAIGGAIGAASLVNPLLAAGSVVAVFGVARQLWPGERDRAIVSAVLLATSSQVLVTAMTPYAMTGHLAFDLAWLWLHLRDGRAGHAGALAVGFLATGLHQLAFHPLFAAPFVLQLWLDRKWALAAVYTAAYGAICLFWLQFSPTMLAVEGGAPAVVTGLSALGGQVSAIAAEKHPATLLTMADNLIRFMTWQNILTTSLALLGIPAALRAGGPLRALVIGLALTTVTLIVLMPYQGHGWGYRYWHGLLGSVALIAALGWAQLTRRLDGDGRRAAQALFFAGALISSLVVLPVRAVRARTFVTPYASANAAISRSGAQVVLVDPKPGWYLDDLVRNRPYLENRPLVMRADSLSLQQVRALCARFQVAVFDAGDAARFGIRAPSNVTELNWSGIWRLRGLSARCGPKQTPVREITP